MNLVAGVAEVRGNCLRIPFKTRSQKTLLLFWGQTLMLHLVFYLIFVANNIIPTNVAIHTAIKAPILAPAVAWVMPVS